MPQLQRRAASFVQPSWYRRATARWRALPSLILVGTHGGGTTALYSYLGQHPLIHRAKRRELHYFSQRPEQSLEWYRAFFPLRLLMRPRHNVEPITLESSPTYMIRPPAMKLMAERLPKVRIVVVLRHPVDRVYSSYRKAVTDGIESRSIEGCIADIEAHTDVEWERLCDESSYNFDQPHLPLHLVRSFYTRQMSVWLNYFEPNQVMVVQSEAMFLNPQVVCNHIAEWLNMPTVTLRDAKPFNVGRKKDALSPEIRSHLTNLLKHDADQLDELLGVKFDWFDEQDGEHTVHMTTHPGKPSVIHRALSVASRQSNQTDD